MAKYKLKLNDPERVAIQNRTRKLVRFLGEHTISVAFLQEYYGDTNPLLALLDEDPEHETTLIEAMSLAMFDRAMKGDTKAFEVVRDTIGEKPATQVTVMGDVNTNLSALSESQLEKLMMAFDKKSPVETIIDAEVVDGDDINHDPFEDTDNG